MAFRRLISSDGLRPQTWPLLLSLALVVVVPTACVLWFMGRAVHNERLVVRQKLAEVYGGQLVALQRQIQVYWEDRMAVLSEVDRDQGGAAIFARLVRDGLVSSAILFDAAGRLKYPAEARIAQIGTDIETPAWRAAMELEYERSDLAAAARAYAQIADRAADRDVAARALQAQARCLAKAGLRERAIAVLTDKLADDRYRLAADPQGRLIQPNAQLLALQLMVDFERGDYRKTKESLVARLADYGDSVLSAGQRRFLMREMREIVPDFLPPTLAAEDLALAYLQADVSIADRAEVVAKLQKSRLTNVWQLISPDRTVLALFTTRYISAEMEALIEDRGQSADVAVVLLPPGTESPSDPFVSDAAGEFLSGWRLALHLKDRALFDSAAEAQVAVYLWTGALASAAILLLVAAVARYVGRQMKLTRLKNDLISTVSHELKTPLSSMRVLVDILLEGHYKDEERTREYLQLIARENARLSHLIDNFLNFSRMERNKQTFVVGEVDLADIARTALDSMREKLEAAGFCVQVDLAPAVPMIAADRDALVTVALNLLDNAYKYSAEDKHIILRVYAEDRAVCLEVEDRGIGLSRRETAKVFDRFYQVDQSLARKAEGSGLGLNIAEFIVAGHGGKIEVDSQLGKGSLFKVRLPTAGADSEGSVGM